MKKVAGTGGIRTAVKLLLTGKWRYLVWRETLRFRGVDLDSATLEEMDGREDLRGKRGLTLGPDLERVLHALGITPAARIIDVGCSKGGAIITMSRFPFARIAGVELGATLFRIASENVAKLGLDNVDLYCADATTFTDLDDYDYVFFYNPFLGRTFQATLDNIKASLARKPRNLTVIYKNPKCHDAVIVGGVFRKVREFHYGEHPFFVYTNCRD